MTLLRPIMTVGSWTAVSRVLGFVRTVLVANVLGVGIIADAFFIAFKIVIFLRALFSEGALNSAFVPLFSRKLSKDGKQQALLFAGEVIAVLGCILLIFCVVAELSMDWFIYIFAPGYSGSPEKIAMTVSLTRIVFPYFLFTVLAALMGGMLNSVDRFSAPAASPAILNIVLIFLLLALSFGYFTYPGQVLAWGVTIAGLGQLIFITIVCKRAGILVTPARPRLSPDIKKLLQLIAPVLVGTSVVQINIIIDIVLASTLQEGAISYLYYADRVFQLPLATIGIAIGVSLLPVLTRQLESGDKSAVQDSQNRSIEYGLAVSLPSCLALMVTADPIVLTLFQRGAFDLAAVDATANALAAYAVGLPAYILLKALTPCFYAREDTITPVKVAIGMTVINVVIAILLMQFFSYVGIAIATAITSWFNAGTLFAILRYRGHLETDGRLRHNIPRLILSSVFMAGMLWWVHSMLTGYFIGDELQRIVSLMILIGTGCIAYVLPAAGLGVLRFGDMKIN